MLCDSLVHITNVRFNKEVALNFCQKKSVLLYNKKKIITDRNKWCSQSVWATVWACMCFALSSDAILNIFTNKIVIIRDKNNHSYCYLYPQAQQLSDAKLYLDSSFDLSNLTSIITSSRCSN